MSLRIIAGTFKGRMLKAPKTTSTRPTQGMLREAVFNICQNEIGDARFLDLFAGSGAMAFEAISRGALHATLVEQNRPAVMCIKENAALLGCEAQMTILPMNATKALQTLTQEGAKFDIVYIDPPYDTPFDLDLLAPLLAHGATLFVEERKDPKKTQGLFTTTLLKLKREKRFGIALLSIFECV